VTECLPIPRGYQQRERSGFFGLAPRDASDERNASGRRRRREPVAILAAPEPVRVHPRRRVHDRPRTLMDAVIDRYLEFDIFEHDPRRFPPQPVDLLV